MNIFQNREQWLRVNAIKNVTYLLLVAIVLWATGAPMFLNYAKAASLTFVSDTLSDSAPNHLSVHAMDFITGTTTPANTTFVIQFDPVGSSFSETYSAATTTDITATGMTIVANAAACAAASTVYLTGNYNNGTNENLTITVCPGASLTAGAKSISIGATTTARLIANPSATGSYKISLLGGSAPDSGQTRVAIVNNVTLTASVDTTFTFTVTGMATSSTVNGETLTASSTPTVLAFGTLTPGVATVLGHQLNVTTNAKNGFSVTVQENQPPTSAIGANIDLFKDGATTSVPTAWTSPTNVLGQPNTYGHIGVTSADADEGAGEFVGTKYAGNFDQPRQLFSNPGPADGVTANQGSTTVAYKIQIGTLQEAANDYTNVLTYVATPTF